MRGHDILLFAPGPWNEIWRNRHQIFTRLARHNRVIWVEPREAWRPALRRLRAGGWRDHTFWQSRVSQPWPNLWVVPTPPAAPLTRREPLATLFQAVREAPLRTLLRRLDVRQPLLWLFHPTLWDQVGRWGERLVLYHIVDEYTAYTDNPALRAELAADERRLIARADLVFVTSEPLRAAKSALHPTVHWVANGVDAAAFAGAAADPALAGLPRPVIGYVGALNRKIDLGLLRRVAEAQRDATLLLVGPLDRRVEMAEWEALLAQPNVVHAGPRPAAEVPAAVAACDIGLLPYRRNDWTAHINSLKLNEYLAAGLPVVAIDLPMVADARHLLAVAADQDDFIAQLQRVRAALPLAASDRAARQRHAAAQDWEARVDQISAHVAAALAQGRDGFRPDKGHLWTQPNF